MFFKNSLKVKLFSIDWTLVCWIVIFIVAVFMLFNTMKAFSSENNVDVYYQNEHQFSMTYDEFSEILKTANFYSNILDAEEHGRVFIELKDDPWILHENEMFETELDIIWLDSKDEPLKTITLETKIDYAEFKTSKGFWKNLYCRISQIGFPIALILIILI